MTAETIEVRVARGVALLDEKRPGWDARLDLDKLDITCGCCCVLGQELDEDAWPEKLGYDHGLAEWFGGSAVVAARYGFAIEANEWGQLEGEWKRIVLARRESASSTPRGER